MSYCLIFLTVLIAITTGYYRFFCKLKTNKIILLAGCLMVIEINYIILKSPLTNWLFFVFIYLASISFFVKGGLIAALISIIFTYLQSPPETGLNIYLFAGYIIMGAVTGKYSDYIHTSILKKASWQKQLYQQAKELNILREISTALQSTLKLDKLLHIILTAITAGYGLGFNRAILLLVSRDEKYLEGKFGIGPMNKVEGYEIWENVVAAKMNMKDFIGLKEKARLKDKTLNDLVQSLKIPLNPSSQGGVLAEAIKYQKPIIIKSIDGNDPVQVRLASYFGMSEFAVIPLINQGKPVGAIIIDNIVNHKPITVKDLDSITPLAIQAAMAIDNANLYNKTQKMAITDGLTGLYNQRYFLEVIDKYFKTAREKNRHLSILIMDIDNFKNYNDVNGHLAGNTALSRLTDIIKKSIRKKDVPCRFGGEEFAVLFPDTTRDEAYNLAETIRKNIEKTPFYNEDVQPGGRLTVSLGLAIFPDDSQEVKDLLDKADQALYKAKNNGKNRIEFFSQGV
ncbi:GGDEF domain-containing protein [Halothermothrix orenii]|uniref:Diguanylate cyclase n=1 Tax=Halothermothrix orenii (strain H 168 / OCM 544 / DSM 9562) TaxID=373903 RepID=B8D025_HALOH|nr:diguanylate cyclase [Halothermothrix orenii]ACL70877.1 diguanylate cyclase [Halothermothrix orenii H 168]